MACGPNSKLGALGDKINAAKDALDGAVSDAQAGIAGAIGSLNATLEGAVGGITAKMKEMVPTMELPSLDFELPELELPELPTPPAKLQDAVGKLIEFSNNPLKALGNIGGNLLESAALDSQLKSLQEKFKLSEDQLASIKAGIENGEITSDTLCKLVENKEMSADGVAKTLGIPTTSPIEDALQCIAPPEIPEIKLEPMFDSSFITKLDNEIAAQAAAAEEQAQAELNRLFG